MFEVIALFTATILFWISLFGIVFFFLHPKIAHYVIAGKKRFSFFQAGTVLFTGIYSSSIFYWSFFGNIFFKGDASFISLFPDKVGNAPFLTAMTLYNWGLTLYMMLFIGIVVSIFLAKYKDIWLNCYSQKILTLIFILLATFSTIRILASLASYIIPLQYILSMFSKYHGSVFIVILLFCVIVWSALGGLLHIKKLANVCVFFIVIYVVLYVVKLLVFDSGGEYISASMVEFGELVVNKNFLKAQFSFQNEFVHEWTMRFAALQIVSTFPAFYFFYIILQGRSVREFIYLGNLFVILPTFMIFVVNSALVEILAKKNSLLLDKDNFFDMYQVIFDYVGLGNFSAVILFLTMFILIVTSVDSIAFSVAKYFRIETPEEKTFQVKKYSFFIVSYVGLLCLFLLYILMFESTPELAVRFYELNFIGCSLFFLPFLYILYKVLQSFFCKPKEKKLE